MEFTFYLSYPILNAMKYRLFFRSIYDILIVDYNIKNNELENISVYKRNYTHKFNGFTETDMFIYNPLNSSDWSTDLSWHIKTTSNVRFSNDIKYIQSKIYFDQFNFNISGSYCDPIYNISEFESDFYANTMFTELTDFTGILFCSV